MRIERLAGHAPKTRELSADVARLNLCVGCKNCKGLCGALLEALTLPDIVLSRD